MKPGVRRVVVHWLHDTGDELSMDLRTVYLSLHVLDQYLGARDRRAMTSVSDFERLALVALWIAAKYEEVTVYTASDMLRLVSPGRHTASDLAELEREVLRVIGFNLAVPTPLDFMEELCMEARGFVPPLRKPVTVLRRYLAAHPPTLPPSKLAASALVASGTCPDVPEHLVDADAVRAMQMA